MILVKWSSNWYGEIDVSSFIILTQKEWIEYEDKVLRCEYISFDIGHEKSMFYDNPRNFLEEITVTPLTDEEADVIVRTIGESFGFTKFYTETVEL